LPIRQGKGVDWARGKAEEVRSEARRVGARGIEKGRRGLAGGAPAMSSARVGLGVSVRKEKGIEGRRSFPCSRRIRAMHTEGEVHRDGRRVASPAAASSPA